MDQNISPAVKEIEIRAITAVLRRQSRVILYTALVIFSAAAVFLMAVSPTFTASALILVDPDQKDILDPQTRFPSSTGRENARVDSEVEILRSDAIALAVIEKASLMADPEFGDRMTLSAKMARAVGIANAAPNEDILPTAETLARFRAATTVRRKGLTYLISVSTTSRSPVKAAQLANQTAQAYIAQQVDAKVAATLAARDVLQDQIEEARQSLAIFEQDFDALIRKNLAALPNSALSGDLQTLQGRIQQVELENQKVERSRRAALQFAENQDWAGLSIVLAVPAVEALGKQRQALLKQMAAGATPKDFQQELARIDTQLNDQSTAGFEKIAARQIVLGQQASELRAQLRKTFLSGNLSPDILASLYVLQQETGIARAQYQNLLARLRDLETQARIQIADSRVISPAIAPTVPSFPNRNLVLLAALAASLGLGVSLAFLKEYYIGGVTSDTQLGDLLQRPAALTIPAVAEPPTARHSFAEKIVDAPLSEYSESIRKLRATIDQGFRAAGSADGAPAMASGKVILVTSSEPNEGKTTTALSLARTYALSGRKTLLVDADLRSPSLHRHLGLEPQAGFLDFLRETADGDMTNAFYARDPDSPLAVVMGASRSEIPTDQLLVSARFEALIEQAREVYDIVILDSPPLLPVVDARYIAHYADAVILVVKWAATSQGNIREAVVPLERAMKPGAELIPVLAQASQANPRAHYGAYVGYSAAT